MKHNYSPDQRYFRELMQVEKPGRYSGGEYGSINADASAPLRIVLCFPDLYEIGMSNNAIRIMYQLFNRVDGVSCERVFVPAPDFEETLRSYSIPLYSLESGTPLGDFDILAFSIGYELSATNVLTVLECAGIPLRHELRGDNSPLVIAGGPAITNPAPFGAFFDGVFIGEAEAVMGGVLKDMVSLKKRGAGREALLERFISTGFFWTSETTGVIKRAVWMDFAREAADPLLPVPGIKTVQDHGVVEIMRGCPNGCRFCHAGIYYRPFREKNFEQIDAEVDALITRCGYREITITSLSSGDYTDIVPAVSYLNKKYGPGGISFSLPSLRVNSFTLPLLSAVSAVRKSGLTFAVETPVIGWQKGLNKTVELGKTIDIMLEAKRQGWRMAKFYFMIGLPVSAGEDDTTPMVEFLSEVRQQSGMIISVNVGTFIPKPHTPYQWVAQLDEESAMDRIQKLKSDLKSIKVQLRYHSPFASQLEGIMTRGDSRVGLLIEEAYRRGARLDAWDDHLDRALWKGVIADSQWDVIGDTCGARELDAALPWDRIHLGVSKKFLKQEYQKSLESVTTDPCAVQCDFNCGVCGKDCSVEKHSRNIPEDPKMPVERDTPHAGYLVFSFRKTGRAVFLSHLNVMTVIERSLQRAGVRVLYTEGFNPKPKLQFASPLSLGYTSRDEIARVEITREITSEIFIKLMNSRLHDGIRVNSAQNGERIDNRKLKSLMSGYWGADYCVTRQDGPIDPTSVGLLQDYLAENALLGAVKISVRQGRILIRAKQEGKKTSLRNLLGILTGGEEWWTDYRVSKLKSYAILQSGEPGSFFEVF